jgi:hypothetical protein
MKSYSFGQEINEQMEEVWARLLGRDQEPSPTLVLLMCQSTGLPKEVVIAYLKASRNHILDWCDANEDLLRYMAASRMKED